MKLRKIKTLLVGASVLVASLSGRSLSTSTAKGAGANDGNTLPGHSVININNMAYWMKKSSAGTTSGSPNGTQADYPIGTGGLVYEDGFLWGAKVSDGDTSGSYRVRVGGTTYYAGLHAGYVKYNADGDVVGVTDPADHGVWRVRPDWATSDLVADAANYIRDGYNISTAMRRTEVFPSILLQLVSTGEETGEIDDLLDRAADYYHKQVNALVERMTTLIEPLLILLVGAVIALMVVLTYLPVFHLGSALQSGL